MYQCIITVSRQIYQKGNAGQPTMDHEYTRHCLKVTGDNTYIQARHNTMVPESQSLPCPPNKVTYGTPIHLIRLLRSMQQISRAQLEENVIVQPFPRCTRKLCYLQRYGAETSRAQS
ncbi:hypothetical protein EJ05DRAFT_23830 [Pseudovirgaria hyperparasitica]|uniref:Uncharacterized protein n=1 Tax=Pseudovirgaria hyperparasitica TaxID=470096 RepID=A0A6A6WLF1_9PEZI|nr:uncharacterized protein EJ05DRAFT_23830 [Pseudovirgaria hyperparasitica]KAF2763035.1 hypothetical protein EJ05DRAFT_23830 [Pseudovirgaria hyperparasitica]